MASGENARGVKALEDIARELRETNRQLKRIATFQSLLLGQRSPERPDAFDVPQQPQPGTDEAAPVMTEQTEKKFPDPTHPYLRRSTPPVEGSNAIE